MNKEKALMQLKDLLFNFENFEEVETTEEDVQALKYVIDELERTAPEVPVQEQSISSYLKANITINGLDELKNISTDSSLEIDTICTDKTSVEINLQS